MKTTSKNSNTSKKKQKCKWIRYKYPSRPEIFQAFSEYLAYPPSVRSPKTQQEFAKLHEVSERTLSSYKKKPEFWEKVSENKEKLKQQIELKMEVYKIFGDKEYL